VYKARTKADFFRPVHVAQVGNLHHMHISIFLPSPESIKTLRREETMKVQDVMTSEVKSCRPEASLATVATMMWENDCGVLPVVDDEYRILGMITDRDIAIAVATKGRLASEIAVSETITGNVYSAAPEEDIHTALKTMRHERVHRLPVINGEQRLQGILSLNDVVLRAEEEKGRHHPELNYEDAMSTIKAICEHRPAQRAAAA
jgi:CBS domain-containing protein